MTEHDPVAPITLGGLRVTPVIRPKLVGTGFAAAIGSVDPVATTDATTTRLRRGDILGLRPTLRGGGDTPAAARADLEAKLREEAGRLTAGRGLGGVAASRSDTGRED